MDVGPRHTGVVMDEANARRALLGIGVAPGLVEFMIEQQLRPQLLADELGVPTAFVNVDPTARGGYPIVCVGCGATARSPLPVPPEAAPMCPRCACG